MAIQMSECQTDETAGKAQVTVGVAVYNGAATLRRAVESVVNQTHGNCVIHISDDASTDKSADLGESLARDHSSVIFARHLTNLGPAGNFRFLLRRAKTKYFMWLAADDYIEPTYIERMMACLESDPTVVACVSRVCFVDANGTQTLALGTYPLMADFETNLAIYLSTPSDNARFYALYRTAPLREAFPLSHFHAFDFAAAAGTLRFGKHAEIPEALMIRDKTPPENYPRAVRVDNSSPVARIFPLLPMTRDLIFRQKIPLKPRILKALIRLNVEKHLDYMTQFYPRYMRMTKFIWSFWKRHIDWRLMTSQSVMKIDSAR